MPRWVRTGLVLASVLALGIPSRVARAQVNSTSSTTPTTSTTTGTLTPCSATVTSPTISVSDQQAPERFLNFGTSQVVDLGTSTRPQAFNPLGVNFEDCVTDQTLEFKLTGCGFTGTALVQVWASTSNDCTQPMERGSQGGISSCWLVSPGSIPNQMSGSLNYFIKVRDIVGPQAQSPSPITMTPQGISACNAQSTYLAVPININFVPLDPGSGTLVGTAFQYVLQTDMVGPPAPQGVSIADGDTLFVVNWTPNTDTDTGGYDVVIDPIPGQEGDAAVNGASGPATMQLVCPAEAGMSTIDAGDESGVADDSGATDGSGVSDGSGVLDGSGVSDATTADATLGASPSDASSAVNPDSGCYMINTGGSGASGSSSNSSCDDSLLTAGVVLADGGAGVITSEPTETVDEAGDIIETEAGTAGAGESTIGGIYTPPAGHIVAPDPTLGVTATGETNSTRTITGLKNGVTYHVVVASVDNFQNVGPPSGPPPVCDFPAPVNDFWKIYRSDGGGAGGGFCALEAVGAPAGSTVAFAGAGALAIAGLRRRRSKKR